jgi:hypothetical protein
MVDDDAQVGGRMGPLHVVPHLGAIIGVAEQGGPVADRRVVRVRSLPVARRVGGFC